MESPGPSRKRRLTWGDVRRLLESWKYTEYRPRLVVLFLSTSCLALAHLLVLLGVVGSPHPWQGIGIICWIGFFGVAMILAGDLRRRDTTPAAIAGGLFVILLYGVMLAAVLHAAQPWKTLGILGCVLHVIVGVTSRWVRRFLRIDRPPSGPKESY